MDELSLGLLFSAIIGLILLSAYFSGSETAMMALNRYRLRHLAREQHSGAIKAQYLLERPDRLLGVILIGNNFVNFFAASLATVIAIRIYGDAGIAIAPVICTLVFLVFAEVAPKTISAAWPERIALPSSHVLSLLLRLFYPLVWAVNLIANGMLRLFGLRRGQRTDTLSREELRTVVFEGAQLSSRPQNMLLGILDLDQVTVDDIMVPRNEIIGINIEDDMDEILAQLLSCQYTRLVVYREDIENVLGVLHMRHASRFLLRQERTREALLEETEEPYFVPSHTPLQTQLFNFQKHKQRIALVVNEYGDIQGLCTMEDILEEIVGEFTTDLAETISGDIHPQEDGSYLIDGSAYIREINRDLGWSLPANGPKTLNGLITDHLEFIPEAPVCVGLGPWRMEVVQISDNMIRTVRVTRASVQAADEEQSAET